jgi:diguanylate cyclase (GGDEF)-like protein/PAS domain S-box-containing protein
MNHSHDRNSAFFYYFKAFVLGLFLGALSWIAETAIDTWVSTSSRSFVDQLYPQSIDDQWLRWVTLLLFIVAVLIIAYGMRKNQQSTKHLKLAYRAFNAMQEGIIITNHNNKIIYINPKYAEISGYTLAELLGKDPDILSAKKHDAAFYHTMWETLKQDGRWEDEIWNRKKSGEIYPKWIVINTIKNEKNEVQYFIAGFSDITTHKKAGKKNEQYAFYDPLTDLANRCFFMERLKQNIRIAKRDKQMLSILLVDLEHLNAINDEHGYRVGDQLLCEVAKLLTTAFREMDTLARLSGDKFAILLPNIHSKENLTSIINKLVATFEQAKINIASLTLTPKASISSAMYPDDGITAEQLLHHADQAMVKTKHARLENRKTSKDS